MNRTLFIIVCLLLPGFVALVALGIMSIEADINQCKQNGGVALRQYNGGVSACIKPDALIDYKALKEENL